MLRPLKELFSRCSFLNFMKSGFIPTFVQRRFFRSKQRMACSLRCVRSAVHGSARYEILDTNDSSLKQSSLLLNPSFLKRDPHGPNCSAFSKRETHIRSGSWEAGQYWGGCTKPLRLKMPASYSRFHHPDAEADAI